MSWCVCVFGAFPLLVLPLSSSLTVSCLQAFGPVGVAATAERRTCSSSHSSSPCYINPVMSPLRRQIVPPVTVTKSRSRSFWSRLFYSPSEWVCCSVSPISRVCFFPCEPASWQTPAPQRLCLPVCLLTCLLSYLLACLPGTQKLQVTSYFWWSLKKMDLCISTRTKTWLLTYPLSSKCPKLLF